MTQPPERRPGVRVSGRRRYMVVGSSMWFTSGISFHTMRLANALATTHSVAVVLMRQLLPSRFYPGRERIGADLTDLTYTPNIKVFDGVDWYWFPSLFQGLRILGRHRPDVVIFHWWTAAVAHTYLVLAAVARLLGSRVIFELHEVQDPGEAAIPLVGRYAGLIWRLLGPLVNAFVVHSDADREAVAKRFRTGTRPVATIPVGSYDHYGDVSTLEPARDAPEGVCNILFFGTIRPYKGLEDLVTAFDSLDGREIQQYWLTVIGETWEGWTLPAELIHGSPYADRITFVNTYVTDAEVAKYFAGADVVALPYHRSSASGPLHVAMSTGLPVVVTSVGGLVDAAGSYDGAVFVPPRDPGAIVQGIRRAHKLVGQRFDDPHSWEHAVDLFETLVDRLDGVTPQAALGRDEPQS